MPAETFSHSTLVAGADPQEILAALENPETWKGVGLIEEIGDVRRDVSGRLGGFDWTARVAGRTWHGTASRGAGQPGRSVTLDLESAEVAGSIEVTAEAEDSGAVLTVIVFARSRGLLAGVFWGIISDALQSGLPTQVRAFGEKF